MEDNKKIFKVVVAGGRDFTNYNLLKEKVDNILSQKKLTHKILILSGKSIGADCLGEIYALENNLEILSYPANWGKFGKKAGVKRNAEMINDADALIAFWNGNSQGTKYMIDIATKKGKMIRVINY